MKKTYLPILLLGFFFAAAYLLPLGVRPMLRPDEFRYAEIPREMLSTGNWIAPRLVGMRYYEKPAFGYQLTAASFRVFGENPFALRLPSALAVLLSAAFLYFLVRRMDPDPFLPTLSTGIYLTFGLVFGVGTFAVLDSQLTAALTLTIGCFYLACVSERKWSTLGFLAAAGIAAGIAFLLKGFLAFVIPGGIAFFYLLWQREWKKLLLYPWIPLVAALLTALPWSWKIYQMEPEFWTYFIVEEHWNRFLHGTYDRKPEPIFYFIPVLLGGILPSGFLCGVAWMGWTREFLKRPAVRFLICWFAFPFLFFSIGSCKLGTYILPCFAPLAVLIAMGLTGAWNRSPERAERWKKNIFTGLGILSITAAVLLAAALPLVIIGFKKIPVLYPAFDPLSLLLPIFLAGFGCLCLVSRCYPVRKQLALLLIALGLLVPAGILGLPDRALGNKAAGLALRECLEKDPVQPDDLVFTDRSVTQAAAWVLKRTDLIVVGRPGEFQYAFQKYPEEYKDRYFDRTRQAEILNVGTPGKRVYILADDVRRDPPKVPVPLTNATVRRNLSVIRF